MSSPAEYVDHVNEQFRVIDEDLQAIAKENGLGKITHYKPLGESGRFMFYTRKGAIDLTIEGNLVNAAIAHLYKAKW